MKNAESAADWLASQGKAVKNGANGKGAEAPGAAKIRDES